jgi:hypothetical protein
LIDHGFIHLDFCLWRGPLGLFADASGEDTCIGAQLDLVDFIVDTLIVDEIGDISPDLPKKSIA